MQLESLLGAFESLGKAWPRNMETQRKHQNLHLKKCCNQRLLNESTDVLSDKLLFLCLLAD